jgi:hypothetical protein
MQPRRMDKRVRMDGDIEEKIGPMRLLKEIVALLNCSKF